MERRRQRRIEEGERSGRLRSPVNDAVEQAEKTDEETEDKNIVIDPKDKESIASTEYHSVVDPDIEVEESDAGTEYHSVSGSSIQGRKEARARLE